MAIGTGVRAVRRGIDVVVTAHRGADEPTNASTDQRGQPQGRLADTCMNHGHADVRQYDSAMSAARPDWHEGRYEFDSENKREGQDVKRNEAGPRKGKGAEAGYGDTEIMHDAPPSYHGPPGESSRVASTRQEPSSAITRSLYDGAYGSQAALTARSPGAGSAVPQEAYGMPASGIGPLWDALGNGAPGVEPGYGACGPLGVYGPDGPVLTRRGFKQARRDIKHEAKQARRDLKARAEASAAGAPLVSELEFRTG